MRARGHPLARSGLYVLGLLLFYVIASLAIGVYAEVSDRLSLDDLASGEGDADLLLGLTVVVSIGALILTGLFLRLADRIGWGALFAVRRWGRETVAGLLITILQLGLLLLLLSLAGWLSWDVGGATAGRSPAVWIGYLLLLGVGFLIQGGTEEVICRGYLLRNLQQGAGLTAALVVSSLFFGLAHGLNPGAGWLAFLNIILIGLLYGLAVLRFSLWTAVIAHASWNFVLAILGLPVSGIRIGTLITAELHGPQLWTGGPFGPEASLATAILSAVGCLLLLLWPGLRRAESESPAMAVAGSADLRGTLSYNYATRPKPPGDEAGDPRYPAGPSESRDSGRDPRDST